MNNSFKGISPVVATALLLVTAVVGVIGFQTWFGSFSSGVLAGVEESSSQSSGVVIDGLVGNSVYVRNLGTSNLSNVTIKIGGVVCNLSRNLVSGMNEINVSACLANVTETKPEVVLVTPEGVLSKTFVLSSVSMGAVASVCVYNSTTGFCGNGTGTLANPYLISDCYQLQNISLNLNANYSLISNIDCSMTRTWNGGQGFMYLGFNPSRFRGSFNGNNYSISNLFMNRTTYLGLFGETYNAKISNFTLKDSTIIGTGVLGAVVGYEFGNSNFTNVISQNNYILSSGDFAGGFIGTGGISSRFVGCRVLNAKINSSGNYVGGFMGQGGSNFNSCHVLNAKINSSGNYVGGFVGSDSGSIFTNSSADSIINLVPLATHAGGFTGISLLSNIFGSKASGQINGGDDYLGGFIGYYDGYWYMNCFGAVYTVINNSYSTVVLNSSSTRNAGFVYTFDSGFDDCVDVIENSYSVGQGSINGFINNLNHPVSFYADFFDYEVSGTSGESDAQLFMKNTSEMNTAQTFRDAGWNESIWLLQDGQYPKLRWE